MFATVLALFLASAASAQQAPPDSAKARQIQALVKKAASLINAKGKGAFPEFHKEGSEWRTGETYLFANDMDGMQILNAGFPEREGTDQAGGHHGHQDPPRYVAALVPRTGNEPEQEAHKWVHRFLFLCGTGQRSADQGVVR